MSSAAKPMWDTGALESAGLSSARKPAMFAVVAFYNVTWNNGRFAQHEQTLANDFGTVIEHFIATPAWEDAASYAGGVAWDFHVMKR